MMAQGQERTVAAVCAAIQEQAREGDLFWRSSPPRDYTTGILFGGFNAAILGAEPLNRLDPRWITEGERISNGFTPREGSMPGEILLFTRGEPDLRSGTIGLDGAAHVMAEPAWNAVQIDRPLPNPHEAAPSTKDLSELLPLERIPYRTEGGIRYFDVRDKYESDRLLGFEPMQMLRRLAAELVPKLRTTAPDPKPGTSDGIWDEITAELAACRLAMTLNIKVDPVDDDALKARELVSGADFTKSAERMKFVRCFRDATEIERALLTDSSDGAFEEEAGPGYEAVSPFLGKAEWNQILAAKTRSAGWILLVEAVKNSCSMCRAAKDREIAYLHYIPDMSEDLAEYYATGLTAGGRIAGILRLSTGNFELALTPEELHGNFSADLTWIPAPVSAIGQ